MIDTILIPLNQVHGRNNLQRVNKEDSILLQLVLVYCVFQTECDTESRCISGQLRKGIALLFLDEFTWMGSCQTSIKTKMLYLIAALGFCFQKDLVV